MVASMGLFPASGSYSSSSPLGLFWPEFGENEKTRVQFTSKPFWKLWPIDRYEANQYYAG